LLDKVLYRSALIGAALSVTGCSWFMGEETSTQDEFDYTKATMTKPLVVPAQVGESNEQDLFLVPNLPPENDGQVFGVDADVMAPIQVLTLGSKVRPNINNNDASVFVSERQIQLWDMVQRFLVENNIGVTGKDLAEGVITTGWQVERDDSFFSGPIEAWRYRYMIKLDDAERPSENIVSVALVEAQEMPEDSNWRNIMPDRRKETELLNSILGFMHVEDLKRSQALVSQSALSGINITLANDNNGNAVLATAAGFEQVWNRIPLSLQLLNFSIVDQDRTQGLYFVEYSEPDSGFFFWSKSEEDNLQLAEGKYRILVSEEANRVLMTWLDEEGQLLTADTLALNFATFAKAFKARIEN
jgi:outer membrane protein assembly factor BamC